MEPLFGDEHRKDAYICVTLNTEAKRSFATFWLVSWDHASHKTFETVISRGMITSLFEKVKLKKVPVTWSHTRKFINPIVFFGYTSLLPIISKIFILSNAKKRTSTYQKRPLLTVYNRLSDDEVERFWRNNSFTDFYLVYKGVWNLLPRLV